MKSISKHQKQKNRLIKCLLFTVLSLITAAALIIFYFYTYQAFTEQDYTLVYISTLVYSIPIFFIGVYVYISLKEYYKKIDNDYLQTQETATAGAASDPCQRTDAAADECCLVSVK